VNKKRLLAEQPPALFQAHYAILRRFRILGKSAAIGYRSLTGSAQLYKYIK
jgi:hypothetical protein